MTFTNSRTIAGKPINEIDYPSITICSHGSMEDMIEDAVKKQFEKYALVKKNKTIAGQNYRPKRFAALSPTEEEVDELWKSYIADYYPDTKLEPQKLVQLFRPEIAPDNYIAAKSIINPESVCIDTKTETCEGPWKPSALSGLDCIGNFGYGSGSELICEEYGGQMIDFDQQINPQVVYEDLCYLDGGIDVKGVVKISKGNVVGVIKNWGKTFYIEFDVDRKKVGSMLSIFRLIHGNDKSVAKFMALGDNNFWLKWHDINGDQVFANPWKFKPDLNTKYKFVITQVKKGNEFFFVRKVFTFDKSQLIKQMEVEEVNPSPFEAIDVKVEVSASGSNPFTSEDGTLSNLKIISDPVCIFEDQTIQDFWYGGILIDGYLYTQSGVKLNDVTGVNTPIGVIDQPLSKKKLCSKMRRRTDPALTDYFKIDAGSTVDCDQGNSTFLCWKKSNVCSSGGGYLFFKTLALPQLQ